MNIMQGMQTPLWTSFMLFYRTVSRVATIGNTSNWNVSQMTDIKTPPTCSLISQEMFKAFQNALPKILNDVFSDIKPVETVERLKRITDHNLVGGKKIRSMLTIKAYETMERPQNMTEESLNQIRILAWLVEMIHSYFIILDDIEDGALTRRGKPCWHLLPDVGKQAVTDASLFRSFLYQILKRNFESTKSYAEIRNLFDKAFFYTSIGQHLDSETSKIINRNFDNFTVERYNTIVTFKSSYYTVKLPMYLAMTLADKTETKTCQHVESICANIGILLQMQNDFLDCYGEDHGTDIQEGKCSWLAIAALQRCSPAQRIVFSACYGSKEPAHIERIKRLYDQLRLPLLYKEQKQGIHNAVVREAQELGSNDVLNPELFLTLLAMIKHNNQ